MKRVIKRQTPEHSHIVHRIESLGQIRPLRHAPWPDMNTLIRYDERYENARVLSSNYRQIDLLQTN